MTETSDVARVVHIHLSVCMDCLNGVGQECHTPGCWFWMESTPQEFIRDFLDLIIQEAKEEEEME